MRRVLTMVAPCVLALAAATPVHAAPPTHEPQEAPVVEFAPGEVCDFGVRLEAIENRARITTFDRHDGAFRQNLNGRIVMQVTNLDSGESVVRNSSGPGKLSINALGHPVIRFGGSSVLTFFDGDVTGPALLYLTGGGAEFEIGDDGFFYIRADLPSHVEDLCATLG